MREENSGSTLVDGGRCWQLILLGRLGMSAGRGREEKNGDCPRRLPPGPGPGPGTLRAEGVDARSVADCVYAHRLHRG